MGLAASMAHIRSKAAAMAPFARKGLGSCPRAWPLPWAPCPAAGAAAKPLIRGSLELGPGRGTGWRPSPPSLGNVPLGFQFSYLTDGAMVPLKITVMRKMLTW
jgi:hypothetical protein